MPLYRIICFLWRGEGLPSYSQNVYDLDYVVNLKNGIKRCLGGGQLAVMTDDYYLPLLASHPDLNDVEFIPFEGHGIGGWTNVLEAFRPDLRPKFCDRFLLVGLDTVFINDFSWLFEWDHAPVGIPRDPFDTKTVCDAVISFDKQGAKIVWDFYLKEVARNQMKDHLLARKPSEMMLLRTLSKVHKWKNLDETNPGMLLSYKAHVVRDRRLWRNSSIVYFHGHPKPADLPKESEIRKVWEGPDGV